jgi:hypothetical protein
VNKLLYKFSGYNENMPNPTPCIHIYQYVGSSICPHCGRYTHEPNFQRELKLFKQYYESDEPKKYKCPIEGGAIRGWWTI